MGPLAASTDGSLTAVALYYLDDVRIQLTMMLCCYQRVFALAFLLIALTGQVACVRSGFGVRPGEDGAGAL